MKKLPIALFASLALLLVASTASADPGTSRQRNATPRLAKVVRPALAGVVRAAPAPTRAATRPRAVTRLRPPVAKLGAASPKPPPRATSPRLAPHIRHMPLLRR